MLCILLRYCFNLDFRLHLNPQREIQKNMGWKLGYRKQYYSFGEDYITKENVTTQSGEGFSPESIFKNNDTPYVFLSLDCYNNNHSQFRRRTGFEEIFFYIFPQIFYLHPLLNKCQ